MDKSGGGGGGGGRGDHWVQGLHRHRGYSEGQILGAIRGTA